MIGEPNRAPAPRLFHGLDAAQATARIDIWRANDSGFDALLVSGEPPARALRRLGLAHWTRANPRLAAVMFATALALEPEVGAIWLDLGGALHASGEIGEARLAFERAVAVEPAQARAWLALALAANQLGDRSAAERGFAEALDRDPALGEAAFGLALIAFDARRYDAAAERFGRAVALGAGGPTALVGLGQSLFFLGDFAAAAEPLRRAVEAGVADASLILRAALANYLDSAISGEVAEAERRYQQIAGPHSEALEAVAAQAFRILAGYGRREAALGLARARLSARRGDPEIDYLMAVSAGERLDRAPDRYLKAHFDAFAETFDAQLVDILGYRAPEDLLDMVGALARRTYRALDLGCGTGLAGKRLRQTHARVVGVDLSPGMLAKAAERGVYDELIEEEILAYLRRVDERFDLILVADTLIYQGDLTPFFAAAARAAAGGALIALNLEITEGAPYRLLPSGRFAHDLASLPAMAAPWFQLKSCRRTALRAEAGRQAEGALVIMERRGTRPRAAQPAADGRSNLAA